MDTRVRRLVIFAAVTGIVVTSSLVPMSTTSGQASAVDGVPVPSGADKLVHGVGYAAVAYTLGRALPARLRRDGNSLRPDGNGPSIIVLVGVAAAATAVGAGVEFAQGTVPGRDPSLLDGIANAVGAVVGALLWRRRGGDP
ncbi:VanZ family protein [Halobaculum rarum]|uniref:VanZ family protein n=1 Tax=Halobaculum rarum TaxID=3075122 RepID=UPI0032AF4277